MSGHLCHINGMRRGRRRSAQHAQSQHLLRHRDAIDAIDSIFIADVSRHSPAFPGLPSCPPLPGASSQWEGGPPLIASFA